MRPPEQRMRRRRRGVVDQSRAVSFLRGAMVPGHELVRRNASTDVADDPRAEDDVREGHVEHKNRDESGEAYGPQHRVLERPGTYAPGREEHDRRDRGLDDVE